MSATTTISGQTIELGEVTSTWKWASAYRREGSDGLMIKFHRTENAASKGQWDSAEMRKVWTKVGHAPIVRS